MARAVGADVYENWTDVSGFLMADPKIVDNPKPIRSISYMELRELSYMGASVMHEDAVNPLKVVNIPNIYTDNITGGYLATKYLLNLGHRHIAFCIGTWEYPFGTTD